MQHSHVEGGREGGAFFTPSQKAKDSRNRREPATVSGLSVARVYFRSSKISRAQGCIVRFNRSCTIARDACGRRRTEEACIVLRGALPALSEPAEHVEEFLRPLPPLCIASTALISDMVLVLATVASTRRSSTDCTTASKNGVGCNNGHWMDEWPRTVMPTASSADTSSEPPDEVAVVNGGSAGAGVVLLSGTARSNAIVDVAVLACSLSSLWSPLLSAVTPDNLAVILVELELD